MKYFNEIFTENGQVRSHYSKVIEHWNNVSAKDRNVLKVRSKKLFSGDYFQDPLPRILTQEEFQCLRRGVEQRGRAIMSFLRDYCVNGDDWKKVIPAQLLHSIIERHHAGNLLKGSNPDRLAFPYGPDIIRDRAGNWRVVEDSAGIVGGMGDLVQSHKILYRQVPKFRSLFSKTKGGVNDPLEFIGDLAKYFSKKAEENDGIPLLYLRPYGKEPDQETKRLARVFAEFGIGSITSSDLLRKLEIKQNGKNKGIYIGNTGKSRRVGALIFHAGPEQFEYGALRSQLDRVIKINFNGGTYSKTHLELLVRELGAPSLNRAIIDGLVWTNFSPGTQFVNDKIFGMYVDKMVRLFLKETPLLSCIPAKPVGIKNGLGIIKLDQTVLGRLRRNKDQYVVKRVDEDGGHGVWIGQKETKESLNKIMEVLRLEPDRFIVQDFEHLSVLENRIVDLRLHAHVDSDRVIVSNTPWGRAKRIRGDGKVNIGSNGITSPVVVLKE